MFRTSRVGRNGLLTLAGGSLLIAFALGTSADQKPHRAPGAKARIETSPAKQPINRPKLPVFPLADEEEEASSGSGEEAIPYVGEVHEEVTADGTVVKSREIAPGYVHRHSLGEVDVADYEPDSVELPGLPEHRTPVDPKAFGFASMADMEAKARRMFKIPSDHQVELWIEERNGKKGVAIDAFPQGPRGTEQPDPVTIAERSRAGEG